jgi:DNA-directed RNA polymerase specialized sigma24 family protein
MTRWTGERFAQVVSPHLSRLYRLAFRLTGRRADAENLLRDVLTECFSRREEIAGERDLATSLPRLLYQRFDSDRARYGRRRLRIVASDVPAGSDTGHESGSATGTGTGTGPGLEGAVIQALDRLAEEQRIAVVLADAEGLSLAEIEALTDLPPATVAERLVQGRARLRELLVAMGAYRNQSDREGSGAQRDAV